MRNYISHDTKRPNVNFPAFSEANIKHIAAAAGIPATVLLKAFTANYSASRAEILEAQKTVRRDVARLEERILQPVYSAYLARQIMLANIPAPAYRQETAAAWSQAHWRANPPGVIDPLKETRAAAIAETHNWRTGEEITQAIGGGDYYANIQHRGIERAQAEAAGVLHTDTGAPDDDRPGGTPADE